MSGDRAKVWTAVDDETLRLLNKQGCKVSYIAMKLERTKMAVQNRLSYIGERRR